MYARHRFFTAAAIVAGALLLSGCAQTEFVSHWVKKLAWPGQQESAGTYKVGNPYKVGSVWYYPREDFGLVETGIASWYGPDFHGRKTANGEIYDQNEMTAAHRTLQMPSLVRVTNLENGRSVVVRINDRGPYARGRLIDVSKRAAELLGFIGRGTARVRVEVLGKESREMAEAAKRGMDTSRLALASTGPEAQPETRSPPEPVMAAVPAPPVQMASLDSDSSLPESLQTPTITVEQLSAPGRPSRATPQPQWDEGRNAPYTERRVISPTERQNFINRLDLTDKSHAVDATGMVSGRLRKGHFLPDAVVSQERVAPTGIFVQAGAFAVKANADRMKENLGSLAPVVIEPVTVKGRLLYRVKLGPIASVEKADAILERVISAGNNTAHVIHR